MPTKTVNLKSLLQTLTADLQQPGELAKKLGGSRATLNRKLRELVELGLVVQENQGRASAYRLKSPAEQFEKPNNDGRHVYVEMDEPTARIVHQALESYARLGIGQLKELTELARWGSIKKRDGTKPTLEDISEADELLNRVKELLFGLERNAGLDILNPLTSKNAQVAWSVSKALRHRMAWDANPTGGFGVDFDEPLFNKELGASVQVASGAHGAIPVDLSQLPSDLMLVALRSGAYRVVGHTEDGEHLYVHGESMNPQTAILKAKKSLESKSSPLSVDKSF
ncbi:winged helix-turn-helix domain-containing protein [Nostoc sp. CHAB 5834]|nr:winged helix-turn-helix domain-containing protein [Nostoc sp. CHAB 5834]